MEPEGSLPFSQEPFIGPYPEADESNPHIPKPSPWDPIKYYPHLQLDLPSGLVP
jgi:hypothetical protein